MGGEIQYHSGHKYSNRSNSDVTTNRVLYYWPEQQYTKKRENGATLATILELVTNYYY